MGFSHAKIPPENELYFLIFDEESWHLLHHFQRQGIFLYMYLSGGGC